MSFIFMDAVIYTGFIINVVGAILLLYYSIKFYKAFKNAGRLTIPLESLKAEWSHKRALSWGIMLGGVIVSLLGCLI